MTSTDLNALSNAESEKIKSALVNVEGWLWEDAAWVTAYLLKQQIQHIDLSEIYGAIEFGTYKGKYLSVIYTMMAQRNEAVLGCDLFTLTDPEELHRNIALVCGHSRNLRPMKVNTRDLRPSTLIDSLGSRPRFISIDAEHTFGGVYNDLLISSSIIGQGEIIAVDDFTNLHCPGVTEGAISFLKSAHNVNLAPFLSCCNKLFITTKSHHELYRSFIPMFLTDFPNLNVTKYYPTRSRSQNEQVLCRYPIYVLSHVRGANYHIAGS